MASLHRLSYLSVMTADDEYDDADVEEGVVDDGRTPLDRTIDRIGMGWYQWTLLSLCGFGWLADNMWIQAIAIILPRVQQHFSVRDSYIGTLSSSMFAGMMFGAVGWGTCSDLMGRTTAFNATLFLTALFGVFASFARSFPGLCTALFCLGSAVGGSMPTDGTLLLEHMPRGKQYLVTALSVFFSFGSVVAAVVALAVIPGHSCLPSPAPCDLEKNMGWTYLLGTLGVITLGMFLARMVFFRLHESPRYLVHAGRPHDALESLQLIARFNGDELVLGLDDVRDVPAPAPPAGSHDHPHSGPSGRSSRSGTPPAAASADGSGDRNSGEGARPALATQRSSDGLRGSPDSETKSYSAVGASAVPLDAHEFGTPVLAQDPPPPSAASHAPPVADADAEDAEDTEDAKEPLMPSAAPGLRPGLEERASRRASVTSSMYDGRARSALYWRLPRRVRRPLWAWLDRIALVLAPEWARTTTLVWAAWFAMSLAYTMFNVYLPKLLEGRGGAGAGAGAGAVRAEPAGLADSLWDVVIYALGGCPGAILGAYLIESPLGRRRSLAGSTFVTALFCVVFVLAERPWAVRASTVGISLSATAMWAVLYGWTPEIFGTKVRGSACGIASALSRIGGMIAPMLGGTLLSINHSVPVYASIVIFVLAGLCVLLLHEDERERGAERVIVH